MPRTRMNKAVNPTSSDMTEVQENLHFSQLFGLAFGDVSFPGRDNNVDHLQQPFKH